MRKTLLVIFGLVSAGWLFGGSYWWTCKVRCACGDQEQQPAVVEAPKKVDPAIPSFVVKQAHTDRPLMEFDDNLRFGKSSEEGRIPQKIQFALDSLASYMKNNPDQDLEILGTFHRTLEPDEEAKANTGFFNYGLARADFIQDELAKRGVDTTHIIKTYFGQTGDKFFTPEDTLVGGISMRLLDSPDKVAVGEFDADTVSNRAVVYDLDYLNGNKPLLRFDTGSDYLGLTPELSDYISRSIQYLRRHEDTKITFTGHTDNVGAAGSNRRLGRSRANTVKQYFKQFGLNEAQINTASKGEAKPIAPNDTAEGRAENRRVEIGFTKGI